MAELREWMAADFDTVLLPPPPWRGSVSDVMLSAVFYM
jgi:hypothetical protein